MNSLKRLLAPKPTLCALLIVIAVLSLMPGHEFPETDVAFADKWVHWLMYGTLALAMARAVRSYLLVFCLSSAYGALMEVLQATLTTSRSGDVLDAVANAFGALCGLIIFCTYSRCR